MIGVGAARLAWAAAASRPPVRYATVRPAHGWRWWHVSLVEATCLILVTLIIGHFLAHPDTQIRTALPYIMATVTFLMAALLATLSGASVNPARQFGPGLWSGDTDFLACYLLAPILGAAIGAHIHLHLVGQPVETYNLSGDTAPSN